MFRHHWHSGSRLKYLQPEELQKLHNLQLAGKLMAEGFFHGLHQSSHYDFSAEFTDYRSYSPGDDLRSVDWRAYARTDRFYVKLSRKDADMNCYIALDKSASMGYSDENGMTKFEYACFLASALSYIIVKQKDRVGLSLCDEMLREYYAPNGSFEHASRLIASLETTKPGYKTDWTTSLKALYRASPRKGLLMLVSDFLELSDDFFTSLHMFIQKGFTVVLYQILTTNEINLPRLGRVKFYDIETPFSIAADTERLRRSYKEALSEYQTWLADESAKRGIHYHFASVAEPYWLGLERYVMLRKRVKSSR